MICKPVKIRQSIKELRDEFHSERGVHEEVAPEIKTAPPSRKRPPSTPYSTFIRKFDDLEHCIDDLGTRDLVYYFREIAQENGFKYVISNIKKDMAIMKRLRENYTNREICGMIEFLYESDQDYLEKDRLSPNLLASRWVNTVYADMQLWVDDKYIPRSSKKKIRKADSSREWDSEREEHSSIGVKL